MPLERATSRSNRVLHVARHAELREVTRCSAVVENAQYDTLAMQRRQRRHPEVHISLGQRQPDAAVLRHASLRHVQAGHDLHAAHDRLLVLARRTRHVIEHAIQAVAYADAIRRCLEVDVARVRLECVEDQDVHQLDHRRLCRERTQVIQRCLVPVATALSPVAAMAGSASTRRAASTAA
jgi:hypothetical protein